MEKVTSVIFPHIGEICKDKQSKNENKLQLHHLVCATEWR